MLYKKEYSAATQSPQAFWLEKAKAIDWFKTPPSAFNNISGGTVEWFKGGTLNTS